MSRFKSLNEERRQKGKTPFANPRNSAAGTLKMQKSSQVARRELDCFLYQFIGEGMQAATHKENLQQAVTWGLHVSPHYQRCSSLKEVFAFIDKVGAKQVGAAV
ncbi:MAG: hypothetical protein U5L09_06235 [Bacteroidales bacterium]|nr:hypothetical protein [Bacteroidales bacterium]